jgi:hypothetical protein
MQKLFRKNGFHQPRGEYNKVGKDLSCDNSHEMLEKLAFTEFRGGLTKAARAFWLEFPARLS